MGSSPVSRLHEKALNLLHLQAFKALFYAIFHYLKDMLNYWKVIDNTLFFIHEIIHELSKKKFRSQNHS